MKAMGASEFKARCLAIIDEVSATGSPVVIRKRGRPVAELIRYVGDDEEFPQYALKGSAHIVTEIETPVVPPDQWVTLRDEATH